MINLKKVFMYLITIIGTTEIYRLLNLNFWTKEVKNLTQVSGDTYISLAIGFMESSKFDLKGFIIQVSLLVLNFVILWALIKAKPRFSKYNYIIASFLTILGSFFIFQPSIQWYISWFFTPFIGLYISIFIINYILTSNLDKNIDTILIFLSFLSYHFLSKILTAFVITHNSNGSNIFNYRDLIILLILLFVSTGYYFMQKRLKNIETIQ